MFANDVVLDDGLFEVTLIKHPNNPIELQQIIAGIFSKSHKSPMVERLKTNHILFESEDAIPWTVDGENADSHQRVEISVVNNAIKIIASIDSDELLDEEDKPVEVTIEDLEKEGYKPFKEDDRKDD